MLTLPKPYTCDHCRNRKIECAYFKGAVCGRCQACHRSKGICTLNAKSLTTGKLMKGPAAEKKAVAFLAFTRRLVAEGKAVPGLEIDTCLTRRAASPRKSTNRIRYQLYQVSQASELQVHTDRQKKKAETIPTLHYQFHIPRSL